MIKNISEEAKKVMRAAMDIADQQGDITLRPEHIMISVLESNNEYPANLLDDMGVDVINYVDKLGEYISNVNITPRSDTFRNITLGLSTKEVLSIAADECKALGSKDIENLHLMLGILKITTKATEILTNDYNIKYADVNSNIELTETNNNRIHNENLNEDSMPKSKETTVKETPKLDEFCVDITKAAKDGLLDPVVGRVNELKRITQILSRRKKDNPIIIGEAGVGKCICSDTEVVIRDKTTGEVFTLDINQFKTKFIS